MDQERRRRKITYALRRLELPLRITSTPPLPAAAITAFWFPKSRPTTLILYCIGWLWLLITVECSDYLQLCLIYYCSISCFFLENTFRGLRNTKKDERWRNSKKKCWWAVSSMSTWALIGQHGHCFLTGHILVEKYKTKEKRARGKARKNPSSFL